MNGLVSFLTMVGKVCSIKCKNNNFIIGLLEQDHDLVGSVAILLSSVVLIAILGKLLM